MTPDASRTTRHRLVAALRALRGTTGLPRPFVAREVETPRLRLRPYRMTDRSDWLRVEDDEAIRQGLDWPLRTADTATAHLQDRARRTVLRVPGDFLVLAIERAGRVIGDVSLHLRTIPAETRTVEIGWLQLTEEGGNGYATEAARALLHLAFTELGACFVTAVIDRTNTHSARLAQRLGFHLAGCSGRRVTFVLSASDWGLSQLVEQSAASAREA